MKSIRRPFSLFVSLVILVATLFAPMPVLAQGTATSPLAVEQIEAFLLNAKIVSARKIGKGVTGSRKATMSDGQLTHDAHIQDIDVKRLADHNFKDQYRFNIAAYRLARLVGLANVPVSVERKVDDIPAAVTWWVDDVMMDEEERMTREKDKTVPKDWPRARTISYIQMMRVFDELIGNNDRNAGNQLWTSDGTMWMIDHTRAFRLQHRLKKPQNLERCHRALWEGLKGLTIESVTAAVERTLTKDEIRAVVARRNLIVKAFEGMIGSHGEEAILFDSIP